MAVLFDLANEVNKTKSVESVNLLKNLGGVLGLLQGDPDKFLQREVPAQAFEGSLNFEGALSAKFIPGKESIEKLIQERTSAKKAKNFAEADRIRKQLLDSGIVLEDSPQGTTWRRI
jgi:cysteinyl-tRNA synthetase